MARITYNAGRPVDAIKGPVIVVDVQPEYGNYCGALASRLMKGLARGRGPIVAVWVGEGYTEDSEEGVRDYWKQHGATRAVLDRTRWVEKTYGFFRGWMDHGVDDESIIKVARHLRARGLHTTDDLDGQDLQGLLPDVGESELETLQRHSLYLPGEIDGVHLLDGVSWTTCGGGETECLKEFELWMQARGVAFERAGHLTY